MPSFFASLRKELRELTRSRRLLVLAIGFSFIAIFDPLIIRLTPFLIEQTVGGDFTGLFEVSAQQGLLQYQSDLFQLIPLLIAIALAGCAADEIRRSRMVLPLMQGLKTGPMLLAKWVVYSLSFFALLIPTALFFRIYSEILLPGTIPLKPLTETIAVFGLYYSGLFAVVLFWGVVIPRNALVSLLTLATLYGEYGLSSLLKLSRFSPSYGVRAVQAGALPFSSASQPSWIIGGVLLVMIMGSAIFLLGRKELK